MGDRHNEPLRLDCDYLSVDLKKIAPKVTATTNPCASIATGKLRWRPTRRWCSHWRRSLRVDFDRQIKGAFHGSTVTNDAGLLAYRALDDALPLTTTAVTGLHDSRTGQNTPHSRLDLLRQTLYSRLAGYEDVNDAERLCLEPARQAVVAGRAKEQTAASTREMARFETENLSSKENLPHLMDLCGQGIDPTHRHRRLSKLILDVDRSWRETYEVLPFDWARKRIQKVGILNIHL
jgi:hypothetical protein